MMNRTSELGQFVDPFKMFPLELNINKQFYRSTRTLYLLYNEKSICVEAR